MSVKYGVQPAILGWDVLYVCKRKQLELSVMLYKELFGNLKRLTFIDIVEFKWLLLMYKVRQIYFLRNYKSILMK